MRIKQRALWVALLLLTAVAAGCLGGSDDAPDTGGSGNPDDGAGDGFGNGNNTDDGAGDGNETADGGDGNETAPGDGGEDDAGNATGDGGDEAPEDYAAAYNGTVAPGFSKAWPFPVNDSSVQQITVAFALSGEPFPASPAAINLTLTDANGTVVRTAEVTGASPSVEWTLTGDEAAVVGEWTVAGEGNGISDENLGGAQYTLDIAVTY